MPYFPSPQCQVQLQKLVGSQSLFESLFHYIEKLQKKQLSQRKSGETDPRGLKAVELDFF